MKKVFFTLIFAFSVLHPVFAVENIESYRRECLGIIKSPKVDVTSSYGRLRYNFDKDEAFLRQETMKKYEKQDLEMPYDLSPIGLTKVREALEVGVTVGQIDVSNGYTCFYPQNISAHLGYSNPTIYIYKGLKKGECLYDLTLRHEKTHMQIYIEALDYFLPIFKETAEGLFDRLGVKVIKKDKNRDVNERNAREFNDMYVKAMEEIVHQWHLEVEAEQLKLDTPEHYIIENSICQEIERK